MVPAAVVDQTLGSLAPLHAPTVPTR